MLLLKILSGRERERERRFVCCFQLKVHIKHSELILKMRLIMRRISYFFGCAMNQRPKIPVQICHHTHDSWTLIFCVFIIILGACLAEFLLFFSFIFHPWVMFPRDVTAEKNTSRSAGNVPCTAFFMLKILNENSVFKQYDFNYQVLNSLRSTSP